MIRAIPIIDPNEYPPMTTWRLFPTQLPSLVLGWTWVLFAFCLGLAHRLHVDEGVLCGYWRPWVEKRWDFTTTIGHGMIKASWFHEGTRFHERIHVWLYESICFLGFVLALALLPALEWRGSLILWATSGAPWLIPLYLYSAFRWKRRGVTWFQAFYYFTFWERAAYSETKSHRDGEHDRWEL